MALAEIPAKGQASWRGWDWRGEFSLAVGTLRSSYPYVLALLALVLVTLAYQVGDAVGVQVGGGYDQPYVRNFQERESADGQSFRWATDRSRLLLPGAGAINSTLFITAGPRPDGVLTPVQVIVNGIDLGSFTPQTALHTFQFALPANNYSFGDLTVDLISTPQLVPGKGRDPVPFGPKITEVRAVANDGATFVKPPLKTLAAWFLIAPLVYFLVRRLGLRELAAAGVSLGLLMLGAWAITAQRLDFAIFAPRLVAMLILLYLLVILSDLVVPRMMAAAGVTITPGTWRVLQLLFLASLGIKLGGIIYPQLIVIDQPWHGQQFEKVLHGRFLEIYRPGPGGISEVPAHWGIQGEIPYSPFLFLFGLPLYLGPFGRDLSINIWSAVLDCARILMVFYIARKLGASTRASLLAAFVMGMTACTYLLHSWGNYPTTYSQWGAVLFITLLVARFEHLRRPWFFAGMTLLLAVTMLLYVVTALFIGIFVVITLAAIAWRGGTAEKRQIVPLLIMLVAASAIAFFGYYVQFVGPILATLPTYNQKLETGQSIGVPHDPVPLYIAKYAERLFKYGALISLLIAPFGLRLLLRATTNKLAMPIFASWFGVWIIFFIGGNRVDMTDKEVWFIIPALAVGCGVLSDALITRWQAWSAARAQPAPDDTQAVTQRGWRGLYQRLSPGTVLVGIYFAHLIWASISLWIYRIMVTRH